MNRRDLREPLLVTEDPEYCSYDDDDLQAAARLRRKRQRIRACLWMTSAVFIIALVGVVVFFSTNGVKSQNNKLCVSDAKKGKYCHAAVASDVKQCSEIGRDILQRSGGNAVDSAIATLLCMGLADPQSMGIGGGFFMTIYNRSTGESWSIDARETAPLASTVDMFDNGASSTKGGLAIAVPGEIRGYQVAMEKFGSLPWQQVFQPAVTMATKGFNVPKSMAEALTDFYVDGNFKLVKELNDTYPQFGKLFINTQTGSLYKEGEMIKLPQLGKTLSALGKEGPDAFYNGSLTNDILQEFKTAGSIITAEDLLSYNVRLSNATAVKLNDQYSIYSPEVPSSGVILSFILNILDGYKMTPDDLSDTEKTVLTYHRITEAFKFAYAKRTDLGDIESVKDLVRNLTSDEYADGIRAKIWDNQTQPLDYYGATFYSRNKTSTAHLSVVDAEGNAVSVTSTINARFGANVFGSQTGIIWNNEMDDFATSDKPNEFGIYPSPANKIASRKRPLSSMCPAVFVDKAGDVKLVVGAAGGSKITTATAWVAARILWLGETIKESIDSLRLHHQLLPPFIQYEEGLDQAIIDGLKAKGHNVTSVPIGKSIVQGINRQGGALYANSDNRKGGQPAGY